MGLAVSVLAFALFWGLVFYTAFSQEKHRLLYLLFGSMSFGSFAVISPSLTGGLTLTATPIILLIIIARTFLASGGINQLLSMVLTKNYALFLFAFWVIAAFITLFMPTFFQGDILVIPVRSELLNHGVPLGPTAQNLSQLVYISISILAVLAFSVFLKEDAMKQSALKALCIGGVIAIVTGIIDFVSQYVAIDFFLNAFRNASYTLMTSAEVASGKRIVGLMPEASSYGSLCLGLLTFIYFSRIAIKNDFYRERLAPVVIVLLILMLWLSTSSAAYVGIGFFGLLALVEWGARSKKSKQDPFFKRGLSFQIWLLNLSVIALLVVILVSPSFFDPIINMIDTMVFQKTSTDSFEERSMWTAVSWQALLDTYGIGVGLGGTRASNGAVALMSNVGLLGALFYYGFLIQLCFKKALKGDHYNEALISAAKWAFLPSFIIELLVATTADFGAFNAFRFGIILAITYPITQQNLVKKRTVGVV